MNPNTFLIYGLIVLLIALSIVDLRKKARAVEFDSSVAKLKNIPLIYFIAGWCFSLAGVVIFVQKICTTRRGNSAYGLEAQFYGLFYFVTGVMFLVCAVRESRNSIKQPFGLWGNIAISMTVGFTILMGVLLWKALAN